MLIPPHKNRLELKTLIDQYKNNYDASHGDGYKEDHLRQDILDRFFGLKIMGWDIGNISGLAEQYKDVVNEDSIKIGKQAKAPDYSFRIGGTRKFFVEAKKPKIEIKKDAESAYQLRHYAWNADLPISILTNFEELSIYDCRIKPRVNDSAEVARIDYIGYEQYLEKFDQLYSIFSKEAILKGSFDKFAETSKSKKGTITIGVDFLDQISQWRETLAKSVASNNPNLEIYEINSIVEKMIERILFLRICEEKSMEKYEKLKTIASGNSVYSKLVSYFEDADDKYDSGIFDLQNNHITYEIKIEDDVLRKIIDGLYYPQCPYAFSVIGIDLLGNVYEKFLGEIITLMPSHKAKIEQKPMVKKAGGVYYTPKYIVDYIVKNTVGKLIEGTTPKQIESIKILDASCGSGSFLIGAYTYLLNYHLDWYMRNKPERHKKEVFQYKDKQWLLTTEQKKKILLANIFGVDLDAQAVEVTKLNLLLKVLENETAESINQQMKLFREKALPNLHENIKCGNSLVGSNIYKTIQLKLISDTENRRINVFDWNNSKTGFGALADLGFDVVIGNPPYIQIQKLYEFYPEEIKYIQSNYFTAKEKNIDIYLPFIEKGISLLSDNGVLGFICPNRFFNSEYSSNLRKYLEQYNIYKIVNFRHYFVFDEADTYTCLLFTEKSKQQKTIKYSEIRNLYSERPDLVSNLLNRLEQNDNIVSDNIKPNFKEEETWYFMTEEERAVFEKVISTQKKFSDFYEENFQGLICGIDDIYILKLIKDNGKTKTLFSRRLNAEVDLESNLVHRIIGDANIEPYFVEENNDYIIFPYDKNGKLIDPERLENDYPLTWQYLNTFKKTLRARENDKFDNARWYQYSRNQALDKQQFTKILIPHVVKRMRVAFDEQGEHFTKNVGVNSVVLKQEVKESPYYFLALLNSSIASFYISKTSIFLSHGFYASNKQFANSIPIRSIDFKKTNENDKHNLIVELVLELIKSKNAFVNAKLENEAELISRKINAIENQIDDLVCDLYDLNANDKKIMYAALPPKK